MHFARLVLSILFLQTSVTCWAQETRPNSGPSVPKSANSPATDSATALRQMHDHMIKTEDKEFITKFTISNQGMGASRSGTAHYILRRPNLLRVTVVQGNQKLVVVSDGNILTIHEPSKRTYRQYKARNTIVETLQLAVGLEVLQARVLDFFLSVDYLASARDNARLEKLTSRKVGTKTCDGFNIKYSGDDWSVWLERSGPRFPCRLVSKRTDGSALTTQTNTFAWKTEPNITADTFRFVPPKGHKKD